MVASNFLISCHLRGVGSHLVDTRNCKLQRFKITEHFRVVARNILGSLRIDRGTFILNVQKFQKFHFLELKNLELGL